MSLLPVEEALERLLSSAVPITDKEEVALDDALGRVLAADVAARLTHPPFDNSAMDGYAVRDADVRVLGAELSVIGQAAAGHGFAGVVGVGEAVRIFTGAPVPEGADCILIQEDAEVMGDGRIRSRFHPGPGRHIRPRGQDFQDGQRVLEAGQSLDMARLTVAAAMSHARLPVYRRVRVAVLSTGDELVAPGTLPGPHQIVASNGTGIGALARENGASVIDLGLVPDDRDALADAVARAQEAGADVLVTLGGASVGDHDLVRSTLLSLGMALDFWKIAMRPGKPLMVGRLAGMHVLGLPGNPASSLVCGLLFLEPLLRRLGHLPTAERAREAISGRALPANDRRQDYVRARLIRRADGTLEATAFDRQDSSMMSVFSAAGALIVRPPQAPALNAGDPCRILMLRAPE